MREILFRGKDLETGRWVYGYFVYCASMYDDPRTDRVAEIIPVDTDRIYAGEYNCHQVYEVDINTVGQFTGLVDKNGTKIFEGDIVKCVTFGFDPDVFTTEVKFGPRSGCLGFYLANGRNMFYFGQSNLSVMDDTRVIGNIYDNPELLEKM